MSQTQKQSLTFVVGEMGLQTSLEAISRALGVKAKDLLEEVEG